MYGTIFYMPPCYPLEVRYVSSGVEDSQFVANMGTLSVISTLVVCAMVITYLLNFVQHKHPKIKAVRKYLS